MNSSLTILASHRFKLYRLITFVIIYSDGAVKQQKLSLITGLFTWILECLFRRQFFVGVTGPPAWGFSMCRLTIITYLILFAAPWINQVFAVKFDPRTLIAWAGETGWSHRFNSSRSGRIFGFWPFRGVYSGVRHGEHKSTARSHYRWPHNPSQVP